MNIKKVKNIIKVKILSGSVGILKAEEVTVKASISLGQLHPVASLPMSIQLTMNLYIHECL